jgi:hypothetical protein
MTATGTTWQCPECEGHWSSSNRECPFCLTFYGVRVPEPSAPDSSEGGR